MKWILFVCLITQSAFAIEKYSTELFCQDLNVILQRVNVHKMNIANAMTTRTPEGGAYQKRMVENCRKGICQISKTNLTMILKYEPDHPDANENGYVEYPNVNVFEEMKLLIKAQKAYDIVMSSQPFESVEFLIGDKFEKCFENYQFFKEEFDFQAYLGR